MDRKMVDGHKDYSSTPLARKLGMTEGSLVLLVDAPDGFDALLSPLPDGVSFASRAVKGLDVVVVFATRRARLEGRFRSAVRSLEPDGRLWVGWPKKASGAPTDLDFAVVQGIGLAAGLVDNKSASLTEVFQGLQFVHRLRDRGV